jgi:hypothetical protein
LTHPEIRKRISKRPVVFENADSAYFDFFSAIPVILGILLGVFSGKKQWTAIFEISSWSERIDKLNFRKRFPKEFLFENFIRNVLLFR